MLAHLVHRQDGRMIEFGERANLQPEALGHVRRSKLLGKQHLERDHARGIELPRPVNNAHAAARNFLSHLITGDSHQRRRRIG